MSKPLYSIGDERTEFARRVRLLPKSAQGKLKALSDKAEAKDLRQRGDMLALHEKRMELVGRRDALAVLIGRLERDKTEEPGWTEEHEAELKERRKEWEALRAQLREMSAEKPRVVIPREERAKIMLLNNFAPPLHEWLVRVDRLARFVEKRAEFQPKKNESLGDALTRNRSEQGHVVTKLVGLESCFADIETAVAAMKRDVEKLATRGAPNIVGVLRYKDRDGRGRKSLGKIKWPEDTYFGPGLSNSANMEMGNAMSAWLHRELLESRLEAAIRDRLQLEGGMTLAERDATEKKLRGQLLDLQRMEERIVSLMEAKGIAVERRNIHPLALLEIDFGEPAAPKSQPTFESTQDAATIGVALTKGENAPNWTVAGSDNGRR